MCLRTLRLRRPSCPPEFPIRKLNELRASLKMDAPTRAAMNAVTNNDIKTLP